ncbi:MAG: xanthine dehydrogenase family protein molybdopterin-binding subunit [Azospirillaceae bacterium]
MAKFGVGQAVPRTEDPRLLTGGGRYTDDMHFDGQAFAYFVRSPVAMAAITEIDVEEARGAPGVIGVVTGADLAAAGIDGTRAYFEVSTRDGRPMVNPDRPNLAIDRVRHVGDPVVMIVAESLDAAKDAADLVVIDYEAEEAVVDPGAAIADGAPRVWPEAERNIAFDWEMGDAEETEAVFARAARVVDLDLVNNRVIANSMEGRACAALHDPETGRYTFYVSSQGAHNQRDRLAKDMLHLDPADMRVITGDVGGGFGMKIFIYPEYATVLYAAKALGRPVKWAAERSEGFVSDDHGRDHLSTVSLALDADNRMLALKVDTLSNMGAYLSNFGPFVATRAGCHMLPGLYRLQQVYARVRGVFTNTAPVDAYRGAGRPEAAYIIERIVDKAAREIGISPAELRRLNFIPPAAMPFRTATGDVYDSGEFARNMDDAMRHADWAGFEARRREAQARGRLRGIGLATYVEACGGGGPENASVTVSGDGAIRVTVGTQTNGQGHETAYKQLVAEALGVAPEVITVIQGDTDAMPTGSGTGGSRSIPVGGASVQDASLKVQEKARQHAAEMMEAAAADIEFAEGVFRIVGTDRAVTLADIARDRGEEIAFREDGTFKPPAATFPNGAHVCELEIDVETGMVAIAKYTVVDDFGTVLNPLMLEGQVHGGVAQGIGQALLEHTAYDPESGQLVSGSFMDYTMPRADNLPFVDFHYNVIPCTTNPLGVKGAGEAGAIGAPPAVINALVDALAGHGVDHVDMPATAESLWRLIQDRRAAA